MDFDQKQKPRSEKYFKLIKIKYIVLLVLFRMNTKINIKTKLSGG